MNKRLAVLLPILVMTLLPAQGVAEEETSGGRTVYILPIREDIMPPLVYLVRRGVKEAMAAKADVLVLDMDTNGGRVDVTEEIMTIISQFKGETVTYVNTRAFSAGAFISVTTQKIYMAPQSVIGAAAPILLSPGGTGVEDMPSTAEAKMTSGLSALLRAQAEKNGHNKEVVQAMIDKTTELIIDGKTINEKGSILTLTDREASEKFGDPPTSLLSAGTVESLDQLIEQLGYADARRVRIEPLGAERLAFWLEMLSPLLLMAAVVCAYIEMKTPGFGLFGIVGICAFLLYFLGGYIAGLGGKEEIILLAVLFLVGVGLVALEFFVFPGTMALGLVGAGLMLGTLLLAMVDRYPGMPVMPTMGQLEIPVMRLLIAAGGSIVVLLMLARLLPRTPLHSALVSQGVSAVVSVAEAEARQATQVGKVGVAVTPLRPGGKAQFGDEMLDVVTRGETIEKGATVRVVDHSSYTAVVEQA
jgi:membrane-bound serine protease (ClpP class)